MNGSQPKKVTRYTLLGASLLIWQNSLGKSLLIVKSLQSVAIVQSMRRLTSAQLQEGLELNNRGGAAIYSRMNIVGYPKVAPAPYSNVLNVHRSYYDLKNRVHPNHLQSGEMLVG